jgi:hypothetical protein
LSVRVGQKLASVKNSAKGPVVGIRCGNSIASGNKTRERRLYATRKTAEKGINAVLAAKAR